MRGRVHQDIVTERQLLATVIGGDRKVGQEFLRLPAAVFSSERHRVVARVLREHIEQTGGMIDVFRVAAKVGDATGTDGQREEAHRFVHDLALTSPPSASWSYYVEQALDALHIRELLGAGHRITQLAESAADGAQLDYIVDQVRETVDSVQDRRGLGVRQPPVSLQELLDQEDEPYDWLIPGLLERMDRLVLTGFEGTGKSYLLSQLALCTAAGLHPFTGEVVNPDGFKVLVLDCENSKAQIRRRYRRTAAVVDRLRRNQGLPPADWSKQLRLNMRPEGIDLGDTRERTRVEDAIAASSPDLVLGGPLYKMHRADLNTEMAARDLVGVLDDWRGRYRITLVLEAHVGYVGETQGGRKIRPTGSSLILRWPEFGYGIRAFDPQAAEEHPSTVAMVAWRGSRDVRDFPGLLSHSSHELPWSPRDPDYRRRHGMAPWSFPELAQGA